jgi:CTP synthase
MAKLIFVTGGVVSSVGKGIAVASLGRLLKSRGISVSIMKLDPYINVDPGTMSPYQHGEVFVTDDGAETDLDLGHYERFTDEPANRSSSCTTGQVYASVIGKERQGDYLGGTIQVIPHITNEIKNRIKYHLTQSGADVVICEVGGTVGDIESEPFLEAIRQMQKDCGRENVRYIHVTWLPYIGATHELKTKPTQHSMMELRRVGIHPNIILCRADYPVSRELCEKIALFANIDDRAVISLPTAQSIYEVPLLLEEAGLGTYLVETLQLAQAQAPDLQGWRDLVEHIADPKPSVRIALVGKYVALHDAYLSVAESLHHAGWHHHVDIDIDWINSEDLETAPEAALERLAQADGILVPGGFGPRGIEGKIIAAKYARENNIPYFGLCLGLQVAVIEFARSVLGHHDANSTEVNPDTTAPVIDLMTDQRNVANKGGTMRLGNWVCCLVPGTRVAASYGKEIVLERHRHRYEFNNAYRRAFEKAGMIAGGRSADNKLVEIFEIPSHPWFVGTQFHPEFKSRPLAPHPLFRDFVGAACAQATKRTAGNGARATTTPATADVEDWAIVRQKHDEALDSASIGRD